MLCSWTARIDTQPRSGDCICNKTDNEAEEEEEVKLTAFSAHSDLLLLCDCEHEKWHDS